MNLDSSLKVAEHQFVGRIRCRLSHVRFARRRQRPGFTIMELIVSASLLITLISIVIPLAMRATRIRQEGRAYQLAVDELNNQLEIMTVGTDEQRQAALTNWKPSEALLQVLPDAQLTGEVLEDTDGKRLRLSLNWKKDVNGPPLIMVGWIHPQE